MRTRSIDLLRGFIMVFMALDHASAMIARVHFGEMWGVDFKVYPDIAWWFTRFISHLCAPGFFFLMGMSIFLFASKRKSSGWEAYKIRKYFLKRGALILVFMYALELPGFGLGAVFSQLESSNSVMPGSYSGGFFLPSTVLFGLGVCMMIGSILWKLKNWQLILITILSFALSTWYISSSDSSQAFHPIEHFLLVPGMSWGALVVYPIIPWLGIMTFGMFWAKLLQHKPKSITSISMYTGLVFLLVFLLLRYLEVGNYQMNSYHDWISFFTVIKYPPSIVFAFVTIGINLILFSIFFMLEQHKWLEPLRLIGQTAMFFYIIHLYVYAVMGAFFPLGSGIHILYILWILGLIILYFICKRFLNFKSNKPLNSFWRMV